MTFHDALRAIASRTTFTTEGEYREVLAAIADNESAMQEAETEKANSEDFANVGTDTDPVIV